jgi:non-specific serine/threonine protein kinase/serine/threonine-protein kinase
MADDIPTRTFRPSGEAKPSEIIDNKYRLIEKLGEGGMGVVYKADQVEPVRRSVAVKIIKLGMDTEDVVARFERERQMLAVLDHPCIAKVFDAGATETGRPYFVMELVRGISLSKYCDQHKLSTRDRLKLYIMVCSAVQHAHQKGVIHRDIKPSNILVQVQEDQPIPKIIDFGIAKATERRLTDKTFFTEQGLIIGTPEYMSPEQAEMSGLDIDTRTDIYSLGVVLYELLVGVLPFDPETLRAAGITEIQRIIREKEPPKASTRLSGLGSFCTDIAESRNTDPYSLRKELAGDLDWITIKAMAKDRTRRYASASELAADVERYLRQEPVTAGPPGAIYRMKKYMRRHRVGVTAAALVVLALLGGITGTGIGLIRAKQAEKKALVESETAQQVSDFLVELFAVSDPSEARGNSITAREILDRGAERIEEELNDQPRVQARLMETMGSVYRGLGLYDQSGPMLKNSLEMKRTLYGSESLEVAESARILGILYDMQGKYAEAEALFRESIAIMEQKQGSNDQDLARSVNSLAVVYWNRGRYGEAEPLLLRALEIKQKALGQDHPDVASTLTNLGICFHLQQKFEEAESYFKRALDVAEKALGSDHPDVATNLNNLGSLYEDMGRNEEAESAYERSLVIWEKILGPEHTDVGIALHNIANLYRDQGKYEEAEPLYKRSYSIFENTLGVEHPYVAISLREQANLYRDTERYSEAERRYRRALESFEKNMGPDHLNVAETLEKFALLLRKMERGGEAEEFESRAKSIRGKQ